MSCCAGIARALLIIFNIVFWLSGGAILGVGIWFLVDKNISSYFTVVEVDTNDSYFKYAAYILIAFGAFVFLVGFCGCCGAIRSSKCLLGFYVFFLIIIIGGEVAAAALMILYRMEVEKKIDSILEKSIKQKYTNSSTLRDAWGLIQIKFDCCGYSGPDDYLNNEYLVNKGLNIPRSCCVLTNKDTAMEEVKSANPKNASDCNSKVAGFYNEKGCKKTLLDMALQYTNILIGVGIGVACLEIFESCLPSACVDVLTRTMATTEDDADMMVPTSGYHDNALSHCRLDILHSWSFLISSALIANKLIRIS